MEDPSWQTQPFQYDDGGKVGEMIWTWYSTKYEDKASQSIWELYSEQLIEYHSMTANIKIKANLATKNRELWVFLEEFLGPTSWATYQQW